ncbi:MAG: O-antigen ligase family protein [Mycobacteriales bacterium]
MVDSVGVLLAVGAVLAPLVWWGVRQPVRGPLAAYAGVVPFGSGVVVPGPLPSPFDTLSTLLGLFASGALLVHVLAYPRRREPVPLAVPAMGLFLALALASWLWSVDRSATARAVAVLASVVALFVLVSLHRPSRSDLRWLRAAVVTGGVGTGLWGVEQLLTGNLSGVDGSAPRFATAGGGGESADPNITAASLLLPLVVALAWLVRARGAGRRVAGALAVSAIGAGLLLTGSRGGLLAALVASVIVLGHLCRPARAALVLATVAVVLASMALLLPSGIGRHLQGQTATGRSQVWQVGLRTCERQCLTGAGLGGFPESYRRTLLAAPELAGHGSRSYQAHDMWLAIVIETGLLGLAVVVVAVTALLRDLRRLPRAVRAVPLAAVVAVLTANVLLSNFSFKYFWLVLMVAVLELAAHRVEEEPARPAPARARPLVAVPA